uniref:PRELI/MSF1 domain-containing protein n=1 Tax=Otolemur garnettii TaxID=30611 RepID=H0XSN0_OTOGA
WTKQLFPTNAAHLLYVLEDSIVDPQYQTMTTFTSTEICWEAWVSSSLYGISRAVQELDLAQFKSSMIKTMKDYKHSLAKLQGEAPSKTLVEIPEEVKGKTKETILEAKEKAKDLGSKTATKQQQQFL